MGKRVRSSSPCFFPTKFTTYLNQPVVRYKKDLGLYLARLSFEIGFFDMAQIQGGKDFQNWELLDKTASLDGLEVCPVVEKVVSLDGSEFNNSYRLTIQYKGNFGVLSFGLEWIEEALTAILYEQYQLERYHSQRQTIHMFLGPESEAAAEAKVIPPDAQLLVEVIEKLRLGDLDDWQAAKLLGVSFSTIRRYRKNGISFLRSLEGASVSKLVAPTLIRVPTSLVQFSERATKLDVFLSFLQEGFRSTKKIANNCNLTIQRVNYYRDELICLLLKRLLATVTEDTFSTSTSTNQSQGGLKKEEDGSR